MVVTGREYAAPSGRFTGCVQLAGRSATNGGVHATRTLTGTRPTAEGTDLAVPPAKPIHPFHCLGDHWAWRVEYSQATLTWSTHYPRRASARRRAMIKPPGGLR